MKPNNLMQALKRFSMVAILALSSIVMYAQTKTEVLTNQSVISLVKAGLEKSIILTTIKNADSNFDTSTTGILSLKKQNVPSEIIEAIVNKKPITKAEPKKVTPSLNIAMLNHPYYLDKDGSYKPLEKNMASIKTKLKGLGYGGSETNYELDGEASKNIFGKDDNISFIVNAGDGQSLVLALYKTTIKKGKRLALLSSGKVFGKNNAPEYVVQFNTSTEKSGVFKIEFAKPLEVGEYFFVGKSATGITYEVFSFSIN